jgi:vacuolar-type H+-ATPase subunit I/STV1
MLRTFIQVAALSLVFTSSYFLIKGVVSLSVKNIAELSQMRWGYHSGIVKNLTRQKADTTIGFVLLLASFVLSLINLLWPMRVGDFGVSKIGVIMALAVSITTFLVAYRLSCYLQRKWYTQAENILKTPKDEQKE